MVQEKQNPAKETANAQDTSEKKFAGKYLSVDELEKAHKEAEAKISELTERLARSEELLNIYLTSFQSPTPTTSPATGSAVPEQTSSTQEQTEDYYAKVSENPKEVFNRFAQELEYRIINKISSLYEQEKQLKAIHDYFYEKYPDLKDYKLIVGPIATEVQRLYPNLPLANVLEKVAQQTREYLGKLRAQSSEVGQTPLNLSGATPQTVEAKQQEQQKKEEPEQLKSEEERLKEFLSEQAERRKKFLGR